VLASVASTALLVTHKYSVTYMCAMADLRRDRDFRHPHRGSESFLTIVYRDTPRPNLSVSKDGCTLCRRFEDECTCLLTF
jgi:hypothetical protein